MIEGPSEQQQPPAIIFVKSERFKKAIKVLRKKYPSIIADLDDLLKKLETTPQIGVPLGRDCYKIRMAIRSKPVRAAGRELSPA